MKNQDPQGEGIKGMTWGIKVVHWPLKVIAGIAHLPGKPIVSLSLLFSVSAATEGLHSHVAILLHASLCRDHHTKVQDLQLTPVFALLASNEVHVAAPEISVDEPKAFQVLQGSCALKNHLPLFGS